MPGNGSKRKGNPDPGANLDPSVMVAAGGRVLLGWLELDRQLQARKLDPYEIELVRLGYRYGVVLAVEKLR